MKFGKYLRATLTPEWKKAYIDYGRLKKCIKSIRWAQEGYIFETVDSPIGSKYELPLPDYEGPTKEYVPLEGHLPHGTHVHFVDTTSMSYCSCSAGSDSVRESDLGTPGDDDDDDDDDNRIAHVVFSPPGIDTPVRSSFRRDILRPPSGQDMKTGRPSLTPQMPAAILEKARKELINRPISFKPSFLSTGPMDSFRRSLASDSINPMAKTLPLKELLPLLSPLERSFFELLDDEMDKVESFYIAREAEMRKRGRTLEDQLSQLSAHKPFILDRRTFLRAFASNLCVDRSVSPQDDVTIGMSSNSLGLQFRGSQSLLDLHQMTKNSDSNGSKESSGGEPTGYSTPEGTQLQRPATRTGTYQQARKKLKKAMLEHYRALEMLDNYRMLNIIGFQKALKKFEKVTKIPSLQAYMREKVEPTAFSNGTSVTNMITDMERLFASQFGQGDKKKATDRLRTNPRTGPHHFSTFRAGLMLGLAVPALLAGLFNALDSDWPGASGLLYVYAMFFVPTLFALLVGLNILAWSKSRINYSFIFDLDSRTQLDYRQYFETPAFLLSTLLYCFWISFSNILGTKIDPSSWPLVWLVLAGAILFNPFPLLFKPSRWWLIRKTGKLLVSGTHIVEFTEFWLADQYCSLIFTISNLYFIGCAYHGGFEQSLRRCGAHGSRENSVWVFVAFLGALPNIIRLIQSVRRYSDTNQLHHLLNGGKYSTSMLTFWFYCKWRTIDRHGGPFFHAWIVLSLIQTAYTSGWDLWMDWSLMNLKCQYRFLRPDLVYTGHIWVYYFAIISNTLVRFTWIAFIPVAGPSMEVRSFVVALFEVLRRFQWNFYRVENEHVGNMDQYKVTKDVRLPFSMDDGENDGQDLGGSSLSLPGLNFRMHTKGLSA